VYNLKIGMGGVKEVVVPIPEFEGALYKKIVAHL
jgi:hypothetical protein